MSCDQSYGETDSYQIKISGYVFKVNEIHNELLRTSRPTVESHTFWGRKSLTRGSDISSAVGAPNYYFKPYSPFS